MTFLAESTRVEVLRRMRAHVRADGRAAIGFGAGRGYEFDEFLADAAGRRLGARPAARPPGTCARSRPDADFLVALLRPA